MGIAMLGERFAKAGAVAVHLDGVGVHFVTDRGMVTALQDINLTVAEGGFVTLLGPSGCGKSTLLRVVADIIQPTAGSANVFDKPASEARRNREIGFVFQDSALLPWRSVLDNVMLPLEVGRDIPKDRAGNPRELLQLVGLEGWENALPHELSGGMRQRVSIARALVTQPRLLLMDEPFGALDEITRDRLNEELVRIWERTGTTILFVTHSLYEAAFLGQDILLLAAKPGRVREKVRVDLPTPRQLSMRDTPAFTDTISHLRHVLESC
jgi:NitT/TauT family transport system ATP-binding protein